LIRPEKCRLPNKATRKIDMQPSGKNRTFLFLQGPHGPFFGQLASMLQRTGAATWRVGFNWGDQAFWPDKPNYIPFHGPPESWPATADDLLARLEITDLVLYGDTRPIHAKAIAAAQRAFVTVHVFEEGYLRPHWVTYERGGANGHSRLMDMSVAQMRDQLTATDVDLVSAPAHWGDLRRHMFWGAVYHGLLMAGRRQYPAFRPHRALTAAQEFWLYAKRYALLPLHRLERMAATWRIRHGGFPYHLALLQLEHDASFQMHSPFATMRDFLDVVIHGFAKGAPGHHHLVFKAHPLDDGRTPMAQSIRALAKRHGLADRVHFVRGGKLARLLDHAATAVTVNSTSGQQALWRGLPLKTFGASVYSKPEFVSNQPLDLFFAQPHTPDSRAYRDYRNYLLQTSQVPGGYYSSRGRRVLLRSVVDMMLSYADPYDSVAQTGAAAKPQLGVVIGRPS
jgi:capsular polysaccharide export protein